MQTNPLQFVVVLLATLLGSITLAGPDPQQEIAAIRQLYAATNAAKDLSHTSVDHEGFSTEGGTLDIYKDASGQVRKLVATYLGETGKAVEEYYLEAGKLRFIYERTDQYNHHIAEPGTLTVVDSAQERFYFADGKLIRWLDEGNKAVPSVSAEFKKEERERLATFRELLDKAG